MRRGGDKVSSSGLVDQNCGYFLDAAINYRHADKICFVWFVFAVYTMTVKMCMYRCDGEWIE